MTDETNTDNAALVERLMKDHGEYLMGVAMNRSWGNEAAAEDLVQEVWAEVLGDPPVDTGSQRSTRAWLIQRLKLIEGRRTRYNRKHALDEHPTADRNIAGPDKEVEREEGLLMIDGALSGFPPNQRKVFELHTLDGMSDKEIAEVTGYKLRTVRWMVRKTREALATYRVPTPTPPSRDDRVQNLYEILVEHKGYSPQNALKLAEWAYPGASPRPARKAPVKLKVFTKRKQVSTTRIKGQRIKVPWNGGPVWRDGYIYFCSRLMAGWQNQRQREGAINYWSDTAGLYIYPSSTPTLEESTCTD